MTRLNLTGTSLGRFEVLEELGRGGMAVVYKARQADLDRIVALKVLPPELSLDTAYIARFRQEARSAARLEHPHIVPIYEVGEAEGHHYIAMKFIQGRTLKDVVQAEGKMSVQRAAQVLGQVGEALDYAHRQGVIHRDIKPSNMMITDEGWVYLTDFGLARGASESSGLTVTGTVMGTPEYMSPEQAQGLPNVGPPTDIYALGVVLYEMLTGSFPFKADTPMGMLAARLMHAPTPPGEIRADLPDPVEDVVMRALARKPEARFTSASELVSSLRRAAGLTTESLPERPFTPPAGLPAPAMGETIAMRQAPTPPPPPAQIPQRPMGTPPPMARQAHVEVPSLAGPPVRKNQKLGLIIGGAAVVLGLGIGGVAILGGNRDVEPPPPPPTVISQDLSAEAQALLSEGDAALAREGGMGEALSAYQQALELAPQNLTVLRKIALTASLRAQWPLAETYGNQLIDIAGSDDDAAATLGYTLVAEALAARGDEIGALDYIDDALGIDDTSALAHAIHSNILAGLALRSNDAEQMEEAMQALDTAVDQVERESDPLVKALTYNAIGYTFASEARQSKNDNSLQEAATYYEKAIAQQGQIARFRANVGYLENQREDFSQARRRFEQALDRDRSSVYAQAGLGWSYFGQSEYESAIREFNQAIKIDDTYADAYYGRGRVYYRQSEYDAAVSDFQAASERFNRNPEYFAWLGEGLLFQGYNNEDDDAKEEAYDQAAEAYGSALELNERYTLALTGLGWIEHYQEEYNAAVDSFEASLEIDEAQYEAHNGLAWSLYNLDQFEEAIPHFLRAVELDPTYANAFLGLGRTYEALEQIEEARTAYQQAIDARDDDDDTTYQEALEELSQ
jgi:eukaryotic-like serine/threonine-protein kinase